MGVSHAHKPGEGAQLAKATTVRVEPASKERGHGRGKTPPPDKTDIGLRGVPVIGHGSGAIRGSSPGGEVRFSSPTRVVRELDVHSRLVIQERIKAARLELRFKAPQP